MSLLDIQNLSLSIHGIPVLKDVSMQVAPGRILGVIGESGSGKSMSAFSVMQLLAKWHLLLRQDLARRTRCSNPQRAGTLPHARRDVGMVFQEPMTALNPLQTIGAQVAETILVHENVSKSEAMAIGPPKRCAGQNCRRIVSFEPLSA
jgi:peptide/nickel transport system ATP-binding protein